MEAFMDKRVIIVEGNGKIDARPDTAEIVFNFSATDKDSKKAIKRSQNNLLKIQEIINELEIPMEKVKISELSINEDDDFHLFRKRGAVKVKYGITIYIPIDSAKILKCISSIAAAGECPNCSISYICMGENDKDHNGDSLSIAVSEAKYKAEIIAKALNVKLGKPLKVLYGTRVADIKKKYPLRQATISDRRNFFIPEDNSSWDEDDINIPLNTGKVSYEDNVTIIWVIED